MIKEISINLCNFLLSLSDAVDLANASIASHQMRTAFIAWQMARKANLSEETIEKIFIAALFHDIGALRPEDKVELHQFEVQNLNAHCILGEAFFNISPLFSPSAKIVRHHHKPWKEWNISLDSPYVTESQIVNLADAVERAIKRDHYILHQVDRLTRQITAGSGSNYHSTIVDLFMDISIREDFWLDLVSPRLFSIILHFGPFRKIEIGIKELSSLTLIFRSIIDFRSRFTATHSTGVAECAVFLSKLFGLNDSEIDQMEVAGNLHDLGKLAIPNAILDKPGPLTKDEFAIIRQHPYFTYSVLNTIGGLDEIASWAGFHHEKLDGTGYPFHISSGEISTGGKIMTVADKFTALAEDRPYRAGLQRDSIEKILSRQAAENFLDRRIVDILLSNYEEIFARTREKQSVSRNIFENCFMNRSSSDSRM